MANLYIGGCSLEKHLDNAQNDIKAYTYKVYKYTSLSLAIDVQGFSISEVLAQYDWDFITFQQASGLSGMADTYEDLDALIEIIEEECPKAKLAWHMTWAYQGDSTHEDFVKYNNDQMTMYNAIVDAVQSKIATNDKIDYIIPSGTAIQNARTSWLGDTLTRDGYHLDYYEGRYIAGLTFVGTLLGEEYDIDDVSYVPLGIGEEEVDRIRAAAIESVKHALANPYEVTESQYQEAVTN